MEIIFTVLLFLISLYSSAQVKIYEFYGGGGNSGAPYDSDYVVLINIGAIAINLSGYSIQYAASTSTNWNQVDIAAGSIPGNFGYFLVKLKAPGTNGVALPTPDVDGISINANTSNGKVALMSTTTSLDGNSTPVGQSGFIDFVGYGSANASESSPASSPSNAMAIRRKNANPSADTNNNSFDFSVVTPTPLNSNSPLPVTLTSFKALTLGQEVILDWTASNESNFSYFLVERSKDAKVFEAIGRVDALAKSILDKENYQFIDILPSFGANYYRLRQTDIDGSYEHSRIITVNMTETSSIVIYPNPSVDYIRIKNGEKEGIKLCSIYNQAGRLILQSEHSVNEITIQNLPSGVYFLQLTNDQNMQINRRFVKI
jgi:hypothetical protein